LVQCLVKAISDEVDEGTYEHDYHPIMVRQNKWHACRYGLEAKLVDSRTHAVRPVRELARELVERLLPVAQERGCEEYLQRALELTAGPTWADRQLALLKETGDVVEVVRRLTQGSRLT
ncbi:MAG: glutamate--cysteine ligase, partial [Armatimonadota bacterium]|nr:glutamate--cysteine ligase [Armatimonadota bacterium]